MKKTDGHPPRKLRRVMSTSGSSATAAAPTHLPAHVASANPIDPFSLTDDGRTSGKPIMFGDSSDDSTGGTNISKVIKNEIVSFSYCYLDGCMLMCILLDFVTSSHRLERAHRLNQPRRCRWPRRRLKRSQWCNQPQWCRWPRRRSWLLMR